MSGTITIRPGDPLSPEGRALIAESQETLLEDFPPEEIFSFSPEELARPGIRFLIAEGPEGPLGCVAMVPMADYAETKRLYVRPTGRGLGLGARLMAALEDEARAAGIPLLRLETGHVLTHAVAVYRRAGYAECGPFGTYAPIASSLFMEKRLA